MTAPKPARRVARGKPLTLTEAALDRMTTAEVIDDHTEITVDTWDQQSGMPGLLDATDEDEPA